MTWAVTDRGEKWSADDLSRLELARARHVLAYLKGKIGNDAMLELLATDLRRMTAQVREWVEASRGEWAHRSVDLIVPGPKSAAFKSWYDDAWTGGAGREPELRAGHPEHLVSHAISTPGNAQVVESIGETELPWLVFYAPLAEGELFPEPWSDDFSVHFGSQLLDEGGTRIAYTLHQLRDVPDGTRMRLTAYLPASTPAKTVDRHLRHLCIEFQNWAAIARSQAQ